MNVAAVVATPKLTLVALEHFLSGSMQKSSDFNWQNWSSSGTLRSPPGQARQLGQPLALQGAALAASSGVSASKPVMQTQWSTLTPTVSAIHGVHLLAWLAPDPSPEPSPEPSPDPSPDPSPEPSPASVVVWGKRSGSVSTLNQKHWGREIPVSSDSDRVFFAPVASSII